MGRSSKSVFKSLISSVKSFNKEKKEPSDKVQIPRKVHQGRCMWSLGKSSSRSSEDMDMEEIKYVQIEKEPEPETNLEQVLDNLEVVEERKVVQKVEVEEEKEKVEVDKAKVVEEESDEQNELDKEESEEQKELDKEESEEQKEFDKEESKEQKEFEEQKELEKVGFDEHKELEEVYLKELEEQKGITRQTESLLLVIRATLKIQAAFRHHLARRRYLRALKALVRLQALVRGRIVRRDMVRLRCINALIKVQSIVRGYLVRKSDIGLLVQRHLNRTKQLRIAPEQGDIYNTIGNGEVEEQHYEVAYDNGKEMGHHAFKTTVAVKQEEDIADLGDDVWGSISIGSVYNRPCADTLLLKQEETLKKVIICNEADDVLGTTTKDMVEDPGSCSSDMSFSMKDEDEHSEISISIKEQEACSEVCFSTKDQEEFSELSFSIKEQEEIGSASAFSSSSESIMMQPSSTSSLTPPPTLSSIPAATLENFFIDSTNITTPNQVGDPGVNGDTKQVLRNDLVAIMPEQPRPSVSDDNEHREATSLYGSPNCGTYLDVMNSRLIDEVINKHMGTAMNSKEEEPESPSLRLVVPNYMATTKSSKAKKVIGSPKPMKTDLLGLRADSLNHIQDFLKPGQDSPKLRQASPKLRQDSPKMKHNSPKPRPDSPKMRLDSPKHKQEDSPKHKQDSPNFVKLDPFSMKRRHSLSVLEGKSGLSSLTQRSVL